VIQIEHLYPELTLPAAEPEATLEAWLDLARQMILAAWMHGFEGRCYFYRLGEIHEYSDCLVPKQTNPEIQFLILAQEALAQALTIEPNYSGAQYSSGLVKWLLTPQPDSRATALQKMAQIQAFPTDPTRPNAFLQRAQTHTEALHQPPILAIKQDPALRERMGFELPLPEFPLFELLKLPLNATQNAQAFAARLSLLLGENPDLSEQMSWRTGLIRMLMASEKYGEAGRSELETDLVTLWHLNHFDATAQSEIEKAWQALKPEGLLLAAFSRSQVEPSELRSALAELTGASADLIDRESFCDRLVVVIWKKAQVPIEMRVLILMRPDSALSFGGADLQMFRSRARLRQLGVQTDISLACRLDFEAYDLVYAVGYLHEQYQFRLLKSTAKPVVGMPISTLFYLESALAEEIYSQIHLQVGSHFKQASAVSPHLLQWLQNWRLDSLWQKIEGDWQKTGMKAKIDKISGQFAGVCDFLLPQAMSEMDYLKRHCSENLPHFRLLPNGCDPELYTQADPTLFEQTHGLRDFLLCVGRIEPNKNQLLLCYALRETEIPIVLVGKESSDLFQDYLALCLYLGNGRIHVLQDLSDAMLASAYAAARLFVLPSASESFPLSTLEAAWAGCPVVLSKNSVQAEFFQVLFYSLDPLDPKAIKNVVETAWHADNRQRVESARALVQTACTWEQMAADLKQVFAAVKQMSPRQKGVQLIWQEGRMWELETVLESPNPKPGLAKLYRLEDLSPVWELTIEQRVAYQQQTFEVYSDLAHTHLQARGFQQVKVLPLWRPTDLALQPKQQMKSNSLQDIHLLCLYHPQGLYGHPETIAAFLQVFAHDSTAQLSLYVPAENENMDQIEQELLAQIEDLGHDPEQIPELAVVGGGLAENEEQALFASASLIVFPLRRLWGQEALLAKIVASGAPVLTQGFMADWPVPSRGIQVLTPFEQLIQSAPEALITLEAAQLVAIFQTLPSQS
jgi:glycosyltransferase involved in cell wall biosynthesis